ncbi:MAG: hypothetical protein K2X77_32805 [Candidatus Obscuribacterales bacterium]|nr:hypothetical protein [Candidatus Obscuribacterales bacterium]
MFENSEWVELVTAENVLWVAFFASMYGPPLVALCYYIRHRLGPKTSR